MDGKKNRGEYTVRETQIEASAVRTKFERKGEIRKEGHE
jgi:hypothetical protein